MLRRQFCTLMSKPMTIVTMRNIGYNRVYFEISGLVLQHTLLPVTLNRKPGRWRWYTFFNLFKIVFVFIKKSIRESGLNRYYFFPHTFLTMSCNELLNIALHILCILNKILWFITIWFFASIHWINISGIIFPIQSDLEFISVRASIMCVRVYGTDRI